MKSVRFTLKTIQKMAELSKLTVEAKEKSYFLNQFNETIKAINKLQKLNTNGVKGTYHTTGLKNVFREDIIEKGRILKQKDALSNAKRVFKGFFVVKGVLDEK